jgi:23S rRNA (adenine-N6)-dimethyltransferase
VAQPRRRWGWHELDATWAQRLVADAALPSHSLVVDYGAGRGAITGALVDAGMRVIAIELHPERAHALRTRFAGRVTVVQSDVATLRLPRRPYLVVANPPFAETAPILRRLLQPGSRLVSAHIVLQDQAARRWTRYDAPGAARWSLTFEAKLGRRVPRAAFRPAPAVDARVLELHRRR